MTGDEFQSIRMELGLSRREFAVALGYEGSGDTNFKAIKQLEMGKRNVSADIERRALALRAGETV